MRKKVIVGFFVLFATYHLSELLGNNPFFIFCSFLLFFIVGHLVAKFLGHRGLSAFGLHKHDNSSKYLFTGYLVGIFFYISSIIVSVISGKIYFAGYFSFQQVLFPLLGMIVLTFLSSTSEDILTRGYIFKALSTKIPTKFLILISSVIFMLNHIWNIGDGYTQLILLLLMGITFAIPLAATGSLWFTIGCHWGWNTISLFKREISNMSDLKIVDHTTNWDYIFTMSIFLLFIIIYSKMFLKQGVNAE